MDIRLTEFNYDYPMMANYKREGQTLLSVIF